MVFLEISCRRELIFESVEWDVKSRSLSPVPMRRGYGLAVYHPCCFYTST